MLSRPIIRIVRAPGTLRVVGARFYSKHDLDQSRQSGFQATQQGKAAPMDAANPEGGKNAVRGNLSGNQENIGFADQVGSQSASGSNMTGNNFGKRGSEEGANGEEEITPPAFADALKKKLGFKTTAGEDKQNRGDGKGVTGTGNLAFDHGKRTIHTSVLTMAEPATRGQAPEESRQPQDNTYGNQNAHLKHKSNTAKPDSGKGNASVEPTLPSQHVRPVLRIRQDQWLTAR